MGGLVSLVFLIHLNFCGCWTGVIKWFCSYWMKDLRVWTGQAEEVHVGVSSGSPGDTDSVITRCLRAYARARLVSFDIMGFPD